MSQGVFSDSDTIAGVPGLATNVSADITTVVVVVVCSLLLVLEDESQGITGSPLT